MALKSEKVLAELDSMNVVLVCSAHNSWDDWKDQLPPDVMPLGLGTPSSHAYLPNLIVAGATDIDTRVYMRGPDVAGMVFAPGVSVPIPKEGNTYGQETGCSLGKSP